MEYMLLACFLGVWSQEYLVYLARDGAGAWKSQPFGLAEKTLKTLETLRIGNGIPHVDGATRLDIAANTPRGANTDVVVYTRSSLVEQTTPGSFTFSDTFASVSNLVFPDLDLDNLEVGGTLEWTPPQEVTLVSAFRVFLAAANATGRSQVGVDVDVANNYNASESNRRLDVLRSLFTIAGCRGGCRSPFWLRDFCVPF